MSLNNSIQNNPSGSIYNFATGHINTDAVAAAAQTVSLGFMPRKIRFVNLTDRIVDEWFEGMGENNIQDALRGITAHLDADSGVVGTDYSALYGNPLPVASNPNSPPAAVSVQATVIGLQAAIAGLTAKLDADTGVADTNYAALWGSPAATLTSLIAALTGIALKLDNDGTVNSTDYTSAYITSKISQAISLHTVANGTQTLEVANGINVDSNPASATYGSFTLTATTMVASKTFYWEAQA